jgi:hypothetical protein
MRSLAKIMFAATALILGHVSLVAAQSAPAVQRSGSVFHVAVCPGPAGPGNARCHAHVVTDSRGNPLRGKVTSNALPAGFGPVQLTTAYGIPAQAGSAKTIIAVVDAYGYGKAQSDLATYRSTFHLTALVTCPTDLTKISSSCFAKYNQNGVRGSYPKQNTGWAQETALDLDMVSAMCPNCSIVLVEANSAKTTDLAKAEKFAASLGVHAISNSFGLSDNGSLSNSDYTYPGIAVTVSSGDSGYGVQYPASVPSVIAVGGTTLALNSDNTRRNETAWSGAGSGCSVRTKPSWQVNVVNDSVCANRAVADTSAVADPATAVAVYGPVVSTISGWMQFGGTSVASPLIAGIYGVNGGNVSPSSYYGATLYNRFGSSALFDVVSGSNGNCNSSSLCTAVIGYDGPTGIGTPIGPTAYGP